MHDTVFILFLPSDFGRAGRDYRIVSACRHIESGKLTGKNNNRVIDGILLAEVAC